MSLVSEPTTSPPRIPSHPAHEPRPSATAA